MNTTQRLIAVLLKAAVTGQAQTLPEGYSLEEALPIIKKQGLATLAYEGAALCGISSQEPVMQELFRLYYAILLKSERQMRQVDLIYKAFEENGIDYLPFKGCVMKGLYPKPELRVMGDADILIHEEQYEKTKPILAKLGMTMRLEGDCEQTWISPELHLELHICLVQPAHRDYYSYFGTGWDHAIPAGGYRYTFSVEYTYLHLFMHFAKHYRESGVGARHVLDLWVYRRAHPEMDHVYIARELEKLRLKKFHDNTMALLELWFGEGAENEMTELMNRRIFCGGSFGTMENTLVFGAMNRALDSRKLNNPLPGYIWKLIFPSRKSMECLFPVLKKYPILLPVCWVAKTVKLVLHRPERVRSAVNVGKHMVSLEKLDELHLVGLELYAEAERAESEVSGGIRVN